MFANYLFDTSTETLDGKFLRKLLIEQSKIQN